MGLGAVKSTANSSAGRIRVHRYTWGNKLKHVFKKQLVIMRIGSIWLREKLVIPYLRSFRILRRIE